MIILFSIKIEAIVRNVDNLRIKELQYYFLSDDNFIVPPCTSFKNSPCILSWVW